MRKGEGQLWLFLLFAISSFDSTHAQRDSKARIVRTERRHNMHQDFWGMPVCQLFLRTRLTSASLPTEYHKLLPCVCVYMNNLSLFLCNLSPQVSVYCIQKRTPTHTHTHCAHVTMHIHVHIHLGFHRGGNLPVYSGLPFQFETFKSLSKTQVLKHTRGFCNCFSQACDA